MTTVSPYDLVLRETARLTLTHPATGQVLTLPDGSPQWIEVAGIDSPQFRRQAALLQQAGPEAPEAPDAEAALARTISLLAGCTVAWAVLGADGAPLAPPTPESAADLYRRVAWLRAAVDRHVLDRAAYLGNG